MTAFPGDLQLEPVSRRPIRLQPAVVALVLGRPLPRGEVGTTGTPECSIVVVAHDNLVFSRLCLESVLESTGSPGFEVIVVDNGSTDGTAEYLRTLAENDARVRVISHPRNAGFVAGCNLGLKAALGQVLVLLNNDTMVAPGWLEGLRRHLQDVRTGMVGPVTNAAPDQSRVHVEFKTYGDFLREAARRRAKPKGRDVDGLTMFCVAFRRDVLDLVGLLDERFEMGLFEDDDYSARIHEAGLRLRLAEDVVVHHFGEASFGNLVSTGEWNTLFDANRRRFEQKWGRPWKGHAPADDPLYLALVDRVRAALALVLPEGTAVLVASRGDARLCDVEGRIAGHFPMLPGGTYAGSYPACDIEAIGHISALRSQGWTHLALPAPAMWWLDRYPGWRDHILDGGALVADVPGTCRVFRLPEPLGVDTPAEAR